MYMKLQQSVYKSPSLHICMKSHQEISYTAELNPLRFLKLHDSVARFSARNDRAKGQKLLFFEQNYHILNFLRYFLQI